MKKQNQKVRIVKRNPPRGAGQLPPVIEGLGVLPAMAYPDQVINQQNAGIHYTMSPRIGPVAVAANTEQIVQLTQSDRFDIMIMSMSAVVLDGRDNTITDAADWYVRLKDLSESMWFDNEFLPGPTVFGGGRYPGYLSMPRVIPANQVFEVRIRNEHLLMPIILYLEFRTQRVYSTFGGVR